MSLFGLDSPDMFSKKKNEMKKKQALRSKFLLKLRKGTFLLTYQ